MATDKQLEAFANPPEDAPEDAPGEEGHPCQWCLSRPVTVLVTGIVGPSQFRLCDGCLVLLSSTVKKPITVLSTEGTKWQS